MTEFTVVIPARFASSRLPGKPLAMIGNEPLVQYVHRQACQSEAKRVVVATDDERIREVVKAFGGEVVMTSVNHESGTDRIEEAARALGLGDDEIVVNVQGDEPLIPPSVINRVAANLAQSGASMSTLCEPVDTYSAMSNPNIVKVVRDCHEYALYFSRAPIPFARDEFPSARPETAVHGVYRHLGIYAYRVSLLTSFVRWPVAPLEATEKLEQLRVLWNGHRIHVGVSEIALPPGVDTPEDLERIRHLVAQAQ